MGHKPVAGPEGLGDPFASGSRGPRSSSETVEDHGPVGGAAPIIRQGCEVSVTPVVGNPISVSVGEDRVGLVFEFDHVPGVGSGETQKPVFADLQEVITSGIDLSAEPQITGRTPREGYARTSSTFASGMSMKSVNCTTAGPGACRGRPG